MSVQQRVDEPPAASDGAATRCLVLDEDGTRSELIDLTRIPDLIRDPNKIVWYDLFKPGPAELEFVEKTFNVHPMALEDAGLKHERPKVEFYDESSSIIVHNILFDRKDGLRVDEISILTGADYLVTIRSTKGLPLDEIERRWYSEREDLPAKSASLLYIVLDVIIDNYNHVADFLDEEIYKLEKAVFNDSDPQGTLRGVLHLKRQMQRFRRSVVPLRDLLIRYTRGDAGGQLPRELVVYYRDLLDHTQRVLEQIDSARLQVRGALDVHFSWQAQRQNDVLKQLTIIATIFLPLSYFSGFFGQNFEWMVEHIKGLDHFLIYGVGVQVAFVAILFWWMRSKRFI